MKQQDNGGSAFPGETVERFGMHATKRVVHGGMTLRDWFAGQATDADIEKWQEFDWDSSRSVPVCYGHRYTREQARYRFADAMLAARSAK